MDSTFSPQVTKRRIAEMLETLGPDDLKITERVLTCLAAQESRVPGLTHPTIVVPGEHLAGWTKLLSEGYEGDALEDTEALYDDPDCP